ncbi:MAG: archease [Zavarzinella sp.]
MFEFFEHTADLGLRATALTLPELFQEMAGGLLHAIIENWQPNVVQKTRQLVVQGTTAEADLLLFDWLHELLMLFEMDGFIGTQFQVAFDEDGLHATVGGLMFDPTSHERGREVKAITYHDLVVEQRGAEWFAEVIVDI